MVVGYLGICSRIYCRTSTFDYIFCELGADEGGRDTTTHFFHRHRDKQSYRQRHRKGVKAVTRMGEII